MIKCLYKPYLNININTQSFGFMDRVFGQCQLEYKSGLKCQNF